MYSFCSHASCPSALYRRCVRERARARPAHPLNSKLKSIQITHESHALSMPLYFKRSYLKIQLNSELSIFLFLPSNPNPNSIPSHPIPSHPSIIHTYISILCVLFVYSKFSFSCYSFASYFFRFHQKYQQLFDFSRASRSRQYDSNDMIVDASYTISIITFVYFGM